jgi:DNA-binding GntR family transcriptional regulator
LPQEPQRRHGTLVRDHEREKGEHVSQEASPRGTFLKIADVVKAEIAAKPEMAELPSAAELMREHHVSRGVALRVFGVLEKEGHAERVPGGRWRVIRPGQERDRRPLIEQITEVLRTDGLTVGAKFPSTSALAERFGVSRPTVAKALDRLEAAGLLSASQQGKQRTVLALPGREERS